MVPAAFGPFEGSREQVSCLFWFGQAQAGAISTVARQHGTSLLSKVIQPPISLACPRR